MRHLLLSFSLGLFACGLPAQELTSPCVGQSATDGGSCPACATDADCGILSNACHATAACVPKAGNWAVTQEGCSLSHPPTVRRCVCLEQVCRGELVL